MDSRTLVPAKIGVMRYAGWDGTSGTTSPRGKRDTQKRTSIAQRVWGNGGVANNRVQHHDIELLLLG